MALDLSALQEKPAAQVEAVDAKPSGAPLQIPLVDIEEDPNQPRHEFTTETMEEMTASIRERGVKTPVSVRSHPDKPGKWILNYGARRYRGSVAAGRDTIPAFVDESHDDYDQVIENIQRDDLKPMELALFIKKRLDAGDKKKTIAKNLGKDGAVITQHLALIDLPACIEDVYSSGLCTSPKTLYELRGLHDKHPEQVEAWCADQTEVTRKAVSELADELKGKTKSEQELTGDNQQADNATESEADKFGHDQISGEAVCDDTEAFAGEDDNESSYNQGYVDDDVDQPDKITSEPKDRIEPDPDRISKPLLLVEFDGRSAAVLLNRRPTTPGLIHIRYEDDGGEQEVDAGACKINLLTDTKK